MKDNLEHDEKHYQQLLELSSQNLKPGIQAQLNKQRHDALERLETNSGFIFAKWRPTIAMTIPAIIVATTLYFPIQQEDIQLTTDIYTDLELLMDEKQLDFLADMEVSEWLESENEG